MYGTCARFDLGFSPPSIFLPSLPAPIVSTASFLVPVTGVEVAKTDTSFLTIFLDSRDFYLSNVYFDDRDST